MKFSDLLMPSPKYATHNLSTVKRFSASPGLLYPIYNRIMLPGDKFHIDMRHLIRTNPTFAPLMGSFKVRVVTVVSNLKNYAIALEGYRRNFDWRSVYLPNWACTFNVEQSQFYEAYPVGVQRLQSVRETSLWDYLGYERGWMPYKDAYENDDVSISLGGALRAVQKSMLPFLVYYDFYRNYLVNPQYEYFPILRGAAKYNAYAPGDDEIIFDGDGSPSTVVDYYSISDLDEWFEMIHKHYDIDNNTPVNFGSNEELVIRSRDFMHWTTNFPDLYDNSNGYNISDCSVIHGGLVSTLYDPDINNNWMSIANYNRLNEVKVNTQTENGASYTSYQDIVKASSLWQFMVGEVYNSGTYADHVYSQYGVSVKDDMNIPQIVHVYDSMIRFEDITSQTDNVQSDGAGGYTGAALGQQGGVGRGFGQSNRFTVRNLDNNICLLQTFMWITPQVDYATGLPEESNIIQLADIYLPAFDNYSLQPRFQEQLNALPPYYTDSDRNLSDVLFADAEFVGLSNVSNQSPANAVVGYQPAFAEYKTDVNRVHGLFKSSLSYWAIIRKMPKISNAGVNSTLASAGYVYAFSPGYQLPEKDALTYEVPFAVENEDNFFCQFRFDITAVRPLSKSALPNVK